MAIDDDKTAEIALAIVSLGAFKDNPSVKAWKALDWDVQDLLYQRGWVLNPVGKSRLFTLTPEGVEAAETLQKKYLYNTQQEFRKLVKLEEGMWRVETRCNEQWLKNRLHPDFVEVGRSGRVYHYNDMFPITVAEINCDVPLSNMNMTTISSESVMLTYDSKQTFDGNTVAAHRSSIWVTDGASWQMRYHQGTPFEYSRE